MDWSISYASKEISITVYFIIDFVFVTGETLTCSLI